MNVSEQAKQAVDDRFAEIGVTSVADARTAAAVLWLDGYKEGMNWMREQADAALFKAQS